jgi:membrane fusion protein, multidrug efflux system
VRRKRFLFAIAALAVAGATLGRVVLKRPPPSGGAANSPPAVPVTQATAQTQDIPIYVEGLGTVQAFNTVNARARVDGQIRRPSKSIRR